MVLEELEEGVREFLRAEIGTADFLGPEYSPEFYEKAKKRWQSLASFAPQNVILLNNLAVLHAASGDLRESGRLLRTARTLTQVSVRKVSIEKVITVARRTAFMIILLPDTETNFAFDHIWPAGNSRPTIYSSAGFWPRYLNQRNGGFASSPEIDENIESLAFLGR